MKLTVQEYDTHIVGRVEGSLTNETLHEFEMFLKEIAAKQKHCIFDLTELSFIMSSGLSAMLSFNNSMHRNGLLFVIYGLEHDIEKLFAHTGIASHLTICKSKEEALEKIAKF